MSLQRLTPEYPGYYYSYSYYAGLIQGQHAQQQAQMIALQQQQQAQQRQLAEHQAAARRSRKPNTREMPEDVEEWIIGDGVQQYKSLREVEKRLDHSMLRKRLDIQDSVNRTVKRQKIMRLWISNTAKSQPWQGGTLDDSGFDFGNAGEGTWRVTVEGRLLDDDSEAASPLEESDDEDEDMHDDDDKEKSTAVKQPRQKFSHFFKALSVEYDRSKNISTDPTAQVDWKKQANVDFDCIEFERKGDENMNITINLVRDEQPERFRLSAALARTLDLEEADRAEVVMGLWDYVKANGLQEDEERRNVRCDQALKLVSLETSTDSSMLMIAGVQQRDGTVSTCSRSHHGSTPSVTANQAQLHHSSRPRIRQQSNPNSIRRPSHN
jgi:SWI/SNF-related matrix-associated actin-dependent regulator of chromatin subfamily D